MYTTCVYQKGTSGIGDHITNVCEQIIYAIDGDIVEIG